jgi:hypothetical protein
MNFGKQQTIAGVVTIVSGVLALACMITGLVALDYNFDAFSDPLLILSMHGVNVSAARWSMILDMFGYYLFLLPVIFLLHRWIKDKSCWSYLVSFCGSSYVLIGALGASVLAAVWPSILSLYPKAEHEMQMILKTNFLFFNEMVYDGLWNLLEMFFAGMWWILTGIILYKNNISFIGIFTTVLGLCSLLDGFAGVFEISTLHQFALNAYLFLAIVWAITVGAFLLKQPLK